MGEPSVARSSIPNIYEREIEAWASAPTDLERDILMQIGTVTPTSIICFPAIHWHLPWMPEPRQCHQNVTEFVELESKDKYFPVHGWLVHGYDYLLHTVVGTTSEIFCITPHPGNLSHLQFIPDPDITMEIRKPQFAFRWRGRPLGHAVIRSNPDRTITKWRRFGELLASGMAADEAMETARRV